MKKCILCKAKKIANQKTFCIYCVSQYTKLELSHILGRPIKTTDY